MSDKLYCKGVLSESTKKEIGISSEYIDSGLTTGQVDKLLDKNEWLKKNLDDVGKLYNSLIELHENLEREVKELEKERDELMRLVCKDCCYHLDNCTVINGGIVYNHCAEGDTISPCNPLTCKERASR